MRQWVVCLLLACVHVTGSILIGKVPELCVQARSQCLSRIGCQMALNNFIMGCEDVVYGNAQTCTTQCKNALISLLLTEDGAGISFVNCNCSGDEFCEVRKRQVEICAKDVMEFMNKADDTAAVSCGLARWVCEADTSCLAALRYYVRHCAKLVHGKTCSLRCNNSLDILYRQTSSKMLQTCMCDGTEDYDCQTLKDNTERLCFNRQPKVAYNTVSRGVGGSNSNSSIRLTSARAGPRAIRRPRARKRGRSRGRARTRSGGKGKTRDRKMKARRDRRMEKKERRERRRAIRKKRAKLRSLRSWNG